MCMARDEWYSLYTDAVETVWREERPELKKTAMLIHILGLELSRVKDLAESELTSCRQKFILVDKIKTEKVTPELKQNTSVSKPTITPITIPKTENHVNSYISPDLFHHDSFDYGVNKDDSNIVEKHQIPLKQEQKEVVKEDKDESIIAASQQPLSPKLNRPRNLFNIKKYKSILSVNKSKKDDEFKFPIFNKQQTPPTKLVDEVIQATPEVKKPKRLQKSQRRNKTNATSNTLTQMYPCLNVTNRNVDGFVDSQATYCLTQNRKIEDDDVIVIPDEKENKNEFKNFINNYDDVPAKCSSPVAKKKPKCQKCLEHGIKCAQHKILNESYNNTFTGFWEVDFTVDNPNGDDSDSSIRF